MKYLIFILLSMSFLFGQTTQWRLVWDANTESDMLKYLIFKEQVPFAKALIDSVYHDHVNNPATYEYIDNDVEPGYIYYYRLKAVDSAGLMSDYSAEVFASIPNIISVSDQLKLPGDEFDAIDLSVVIIDQDTPLDSIDVRFQSNQFMFNRIGNLIHPVLLDTNWTGSEEINMVAEDVDGFFDLATFFLAIKQKPNQTILHWPLSVESPPF